MAKIDIHAQVTDKILEMMETATKWEKPWLGNASGGLGFPYNAITGKHYQGINVLLLWASGFESQVWATYKQWASLGAQVNQGQKATRCCYYGKAEKTDSEGNVKEFFFLKGFSVFNSEQVSNWENAEESSEPIEPKSDSELCSETESFIQNTKADIRFGGAKACYSPSLDKIMMPHLDSFKPTNDATQTQNYYATLLHELTHWTGHESRCNRQFGGRFGDSSYAFEELIAELGAAFLMVQQGITPMPIQGHANYLKSWIKVLKEDKKAIFTAASAAQKAVNHLNELQA